MMRQLILKIWMGLFFSSLFFSSFSQINSNWTCADKTLNELLRQQVQGYDQAEQKINEQLQQYIKITLQSKKQPVFTESFTPDSMYTIPVVVHVIFPAGQSYGTGSNISYAQIRSQIEALNAAFSKNYPAYNGQNHAVYAKDSRIRFCLARTAAPGNASWATGPGGIEYGVKRYSNNTGIYNHEITNASASQLLNLTHPSAGYFPFDKYLNIWLVQSVGGDNIMGYAPRPLIPGYPLDGIVMRADVFGDNTTGGNYLLGFGLTQGKVLVHEAGHYFNLYHIFQNGCAGANPSGAATDACDLNGDMICDIEPSTTQNVFCTSDIYNTCTANYNTGTTTADMINDYMSYADDDCMNTFTQDQLYRMWATLDLQRHTLWQATNLAETGILGANGCIPPYLNALISTNNAVYCAGQPIQFSNPQSGNTATSYQWEFPNGTPSSGSTNSTTVTFNTTGNYKAILTVSDGNISRKDSLLFTVLSCVLDSSLLHMSHWYFGDFCSLDFSSGAPVQTTVALQKNTMKGESSYPAQLPYVSATISLSDTLGQLLFYSNGVSVWNKNHQKISTAPIFGASDINASTGICYVPYPGQPGRYFIVGASSNLFPAGTHKIRFVLVDLNADTVSVYQEFRGSIAVPLPVKFSEFLTVVPHCNGTDYWVITKGYGLDDTRFVSFLVTNAGIDRSQTPVISGNIIHPGYQGSGNQLKANKQGDKLILSSPHGSASIEGGALYDFDSRMGEVKNERRIPNVPGYNNVQSGTAFSPNGDYFYLMRSTNLVSNGPPYWLFQYRVSDMRFNVIPTTGHYFLDPFQLGPDNQLYIINAYGYLARLSNPDKWNEATFNGEFIYFRSAGMAVGSGASLPSFIDAKQPKPTRPDFSIKTTTCNTYIFSSLCFDNYTATWNFGDGSPAQTGNSITHSYSQPGDFNVSLTLSIANIIVGSTAKKIIVLPLSINITGPETICNNGDYATQYYAPLVKEVSYKWSVTNGSISGPDNLSYAEIIWSSTSTAGTVKLEVTRDNCNIVTTKSVSITPGPGINWQLKDSVCVFDTAFQLIATPSGGIFRGPGVRNNIFSPSGAGAGNHRLLYSYFNESSCYQEVEKIIKVSLCNTPGRTGSQCEEVFNTIIITPNPVNDILKLQSPFKLGYIQIYNIAGQKVAAGELTNNSFTLPYLARGVYVLLVYCQDKISFRTFKLIK